MLAKSIKLTVKSEIDHLTLLWKAVQAICITVVKDEILLYNLGLCLTEAVMNVINHVYKNKPGKIIEIIITLSENKIVFRIIDTGNGGHVPQPKTLDYNPEDIPSLPEKGFGLFFIHRIMDEVTQNIRGDKHVLLMKKHLNRKKM